MPEMVMPEKEIDEIEVREFPDDIDDSVELQQLEEQEDNQPLPPLPQKKEKLKKEDIFKPKQPPAVSAKKVKIDDDLTEPIIPKIALVRKKRELSDAQKEALARGRAKRAANKQQVTEKPVKTYKPDPEEASYKEKKMNEDYIRQHSPLRSDNGLTQDQLQEAIFRGVAIYDNMRKERKAEKKKQQMAQAHNQRVLTDLNSQMRGNDIWASAFNF